MTKMQVQGKEWEMPHAKPVLGLKKSQFEYTTKQMQTNLLARISHFLWRLLFGHP